MVNPDMDGSFLTETDPLELCFDDDYVECSNVPLGSTCISNPDGVGNEIVKATVTIDFTLILW